MSPPKPESPRPSRGLAAFGEDPTIAGVLRLLSAGGGTTLTGLVVIGWMQFVSPFIAAVKADLAAIRSQNQLLAEHVAQLEAKVGVSPPITSDPRWLLQSLPPGSVFWPSIATADGATLPATVGGSGEATADTGLDLPVARVPAAGGVAGR